MISSLHHNSITSLLYFIISLLHYYFTDSYCIFFVCSSGSFKVQSTNYYMIQSVATGLCLTSNDIPTTLAPGPQPRMITCDNSNINSYWQLVKEQDYVYGIVNYNNGLVLDGNLDAITACSHSTYETKKYIINKIKIRK